MKHVAQNSPIYDLLQFHNRLIDIVDPPYLRNIREHAERLQRIAEPLRLNSLYDPLSGISNILNGIAKQHNNIAIPKFDLPKLDDLEFFKILNDFRNHSAFSNAVSLEELTEEQTQETVSTALDICIFLHTKVENYQIKVVESYKLIEPKLRLYVNTIIKFIFAKAADMALEEVIEALID